MLKPNRAFLMFAVAFAVLNFVAVAQVSDPVLSAQAPVPGVGHHYIGIGAETVNPADGSLSFNLPIQTPPGRGLTLTVGIHYNSSEQAHFTGIMSGSNCVQNCAWVGPFALDDFPGWSYGLPVYVAQAWVTGTAPGPPCQPYPSCQRTEYCWGSGNYIFSTGAEGLHPLYVMNDWPDPNNDMNVGCSTSGVSQGSGGNGIVAYLGTLGSPNQPPLTISNRTGTVYQFGQGPYLNWLPAVAPVPWTMLAQSITDRNGNRITLNAPSSCAGNCRLQAGSYVDTLGRNVVSWSGLGNAAGDQLTVSGLSGNISLKWVTNTFSFWTQQYFVNGSAQDELHCGITGRKENVPLRTASEIDLPNGQKYTFAYGGTWGRLQKIVYPDGGYVRYVWGVNANSNGAETSWVDFNGNNQYCFYKFDTLAITDRYVSFDGSTEAIHQKFSYSTNWTTTPSGAPAWLSKATTVTMTDLLTNQTTTTTYTYGSVQQPILDPGCSGDCAGRFAFPRAINQIPVETQIRYGGGTANKTVNKTWADQYGMIGEQTILDNGQGMTILRCLDGAERVLASYEYGFQNEGTKPADPLCSVQPRAPAPPPGSTLSYGLNPSAMGPLRRQTVAAYHQFPSSSTIDAPDSVTVYDDSGKVKQTIYGYDEYLVVQSGAQTGLVAPPGSRGNTTSVSRWLNTNDSYLKTTYTYYDTGQVASMTDPCGNTTCNDMPGTSGANHTTTYSYNGTFASGTGTPPGQTNAYLTMVTYPNTGADHIENFSWGYVDGLLRSFSDQNGRAIAYEYNDALGRLTKVSSPDGGQTTYAYNDASFNASNNTPNITATQKITSALNKVTVTAGDGMGQVVRELMTSDPDGTDITDTTYDGFARLWKKSNPHRSTGLPTDGTQTISFDGLGRTVQVKEADGSLVNTSYFGNCSTVTDEAGKVRTSCTDSLGRLSEVDEPAAGAMIGTPGTGSVTIAGSERFVTINSCPNQYPFNCPTPVWDSGTVSITVNGYAASTLYYCSGCGYPSDPSSIAAALAASLNLSGSPVTATANGGVVNMTSRITGTAVNYSLSSSVCCWNTQYFSQPSFTATRSGSTLTGGSGQQGNTLLVTRYLYDALDNLTCVVQKGVDLTTFSSCSASPASWRPRSFIYDSLSRLTSATNPESGTLNYSYDANGNLASKVAPMPNTNATQTITTNYFYDSLNRLTKKMYGDSTPTVQYGYDGIALSGCTFAPPSMADSNPVNRRTSMCDGSGSTTWARDINPGVGWKTTEKRNINSVVGTIVSQDNFGGILYQLTYPGGRTVTYTPNGSAGTAARISSAVDSTNGVNYAQNATYAPFGALRSVTHGAAIKITDIFNSRLQPCWLYATTGTALSATSTCTATAATGTIQDVKYNFGLGTNDNGNVLSIANNRDPNRSQTFTYDALNRIATAVSQANSGPACWGDTFTIDAWGNLTNKTPSKCVAETLSVAVMNSNQISGFCYDGAGNLLGKAGCPQSAYTYDAENRLKSTAGLTYLYDGDGNRVMKSSGTLYWGTGPLAESDSVGNMQREYVFLNGKRVARRDVSSNTVHYYFSDHLGSTSLVTDSNGTMSLCPPANSPLGYTTVATGEEESDYFPYGGERQLCDRSSQNYKFTGKERDAESGLDYFGARYDASSLGRFMSPDSIANDWELLNPQTWNRYAYARNNPLVYVDPDGAAAELICTGEKEADCRAQREKSLKTLQDSVGNKEAASRLYINEVKDGDKTRYFVGIKGDVGEFMKLSDTAHDLANLIQDKQVVEYAVTKQDLSEWGGAVTYDKGEAGNQNVRVLVNPDQADIATVRLQSTLLGAMRFEGWDKTPRWRVRDMTPETMSWHELGHGWGSIHGRTGGKSNSEADAWENRMRQQVYGPLGPNNARRINH